MSATSTVFHTSALLAARPITPAPESTDRLAELVQHLGDVSLLEARQAVELVPEPANRLDPLSVVAAALVHLRRNRYRPVSA